MIEQPSSIEDEYELKVLAIHGLGVGKPQVALQHANTSINLFDVTV